MATVSQVRRETRRATPLSAGKTAHAPELRSPRQDSAHFLTYFSVPAPHVLTAKIGNECHVGKGLSNDFVETQVPTCQPLDSLASIIYLLEILYFIGINEKLLAR